MLDDTKTNLEKYVKHVEVFCEHEKKLIKSYANEILRIVNGISESSLTLEDLQTLPDLTLFYGFTGVSGFPGLDGDLNAHQLEIDSLNYIKKQIIEVLKSQPN